MQLSFLGFLFMLLSSLKLRLVTPDCLVTRNYARFRRSLPVRKPRTEPRISNRIVGGSYADVNYPFMVSILKFNKFIGGGIIIDRHWILSAAHLFMEKKGRTLDLHKYRIGYGSNLRSAHKLVPPQSIYSHYLFNNITFQDDIALVRTQDPLLYRNRTSIIYLPFPPKREPLKPEDLTILGWGDLKLNVINEKGVLKSGNVKVISGELCRGIFRSYQINKKHICLISKDSQGDRVGACSGDSGGPALELLDSKPILVGISSWTDDRCNPHYPSVFTKVSHYLEWICSTVKNHEQRFRKS